MSLKMGEIMLVQIGESGKLIMVSYNINGKYWYDINRPLMHYDKSELKFDIDFKEKPVSYEIALLAKKKGFLQSIHKIKDSYLPLYSDGSGLQLNSSLFSPENNICSAPLPSQLSKWLRDVFGLVIGIVPITNHSGYYHYIIEDTINGKSIPIIIELPYEAALAEAHLTALNMLP